MSTTQMIGAALVAAGLAGLAGIRWYVVRSRRTLEAHRPSRHRRR